MAEPYPEHSETLLAATLPPPPADAPAASSRPELFFDRYRVIRELGRGGMGQVLLARDEELGQHVAIKVVPDLLVKDTEAVGDLKKEVLRGMALTHPGIVRTHNFERDAEGAAIIMEYIDGRTLTDLKAEQPDGCFDPEGILPWLEQLCAALDYAHSEARIVHRDLKPRNLMITAAGRLKVADFGISALLTETVTRSTGEHMSSGTPSYMGPQQAAGKKPSPLDDVYALGATIYDLLTGKPPFFRGHILVQVMDEIPPTMMERREEFGVAPERRIPAAWEETVAACLAKDPTQRPQSAGEVFRRLTGAVPDLTSPGSVVPAKLALDSDASRTLSAVNQDATVPRPIATELTYVRLPAEQPRRSLFFLLGWEFFALIAMGAGGVWWIREHHKPNAPEPAIVQATPAPVQMTMLATPTPRPRLAATPVPEPLVQRTAAPSVVYVLPPPPPPPPPEEMMRQMGRPMDGQPQPPGGPNGPGFGGRPGMGPRR